MDPKILLQVKYDGVLGICSRCHAENADEFGSVAIYVKGSRDLNRKAYPNKSYYIWQP